MEIAAHIGALRTEGERMVAAVATADPDGGVPSCPEWRVRDLVRHLGGVHRWATSFVATARTDPSRADLDEVVGSWPEDEDLACWIGRGCTDLVAALEAAPDDLQCWTFLPAPSPRAMWARRQAHETAIHRVDTEQAAGAAVTPLEAAFAADGVDELLQQFVPRRSTKLRADPPVTLGVGCTDVDASWLLRLDTEGVHTTPAPRRDEAPDCSVRGTAAALSLTLWSRSVSEHLTVEGDRAVLDRFSEGVRIRWS